MATLISNTSICTGGIRHTSKENQSWNKPHEKASINMSYGTEAYRAAILAQFAAGN